MRASYSIAAVALLCHEAFAQPAGGVAALIGNLEAIVKSPASLTENAATSTVTGSMTVSPTETIPVATQTASSDRCSVGYSTGGNGEGNRSEIGQATSSRDCCEQCQEKLNCVASVYTGTACLHLINSQLAGAETSDQCPLGIEDYAFGEPGGMVYPGPCSH